LSHGRLRPALNQIPQFGVLKDFKSLFVHPIEKVFLYE
jgi:hypothetical protein